jgi:hypothetical protein
MSYTNGKNLSSIESQPYKQQKGVILINIIKTLEKYGFKETIPDKNMLFDGMILPIDQSRYLWKTSWLSLLSGSYGIYMKHYDLAVIPLGVFITSLNYWRKPIYGWRRNIDITYVTIGLLYQLNTSFYADNKTKTLYFLLSLLSATLYPISIITFKKSMWISTIIHSGIHIIGNISNIILYNGNIKK